MIGEALEGTERKGRGRGKDDDDEDLDRVALTSLVQYGAKNLLETEGREVQTEDLDVELAQYLSKASENLPDPPDDMEEDLMDLDIDVNVTAASKSMNGESHVAGVDVAQATSCPTSEACDRTASSSSSATADITEDSNLLRENSTESVESTAVSTGTVSEGRQKRTRRPTKIYQPAEINRCSKIYAKCRIAISIPLVFNTKLSTMIVDNFICWYAGRKGRGSLERMSRSAFVATTVATYLNVTFVPRCITLSVWATQKYHPECGNAPGEFPICIQFFSYGAPLVSH